MKTNFEKVFTGGLNDSGGRKSVTFKKDMLAHHSLMNKAANSSSSKNLAVAGNQVSGGGSGFVTEKTQSNIRTTS